MANIKRARTLIDVMCEAEALSLLRSSSARAPKEVDRIVALAGVLAWVVKHDPRPMGRIIGRTTLEQEDSAILAESRFRRLLQTPPEPEDLMHAMRRLVRVAKGEVNVNDLSLAMLRWGHAVKRQWILDYYAANVVAPDGEEPAASRKDKPQTHQKEMFNE